jgi:dihydroorotate dehydrogenase
VLYQLVRPLLFALPAETVHGLAHAGLASLQAVLERTGTPAVASDPVLGQDLWGLHFPNPLGLAAGFDKNGALPHVWAALGFGFAEIGTVTARAQPGNPPPRLFRLTDAQALINRLGFNNDGADAVAAALRAHLAHHPLGIPLGINLGKSRTTPLADAVDDYRASLAALYDCAAYVVVNVSSPNTPGLRDLQTESQLTPLLRALQDDNRRLAGERGIPPRPLLVKLAPDLDDDALGAIVDAATAAAADGLIATNTTLDRSALPSDHPLGREAGGLSGAPLRARATAVVRRLYQLSRGRVPIIGVGGVFTAADAYEKIRAGASLVQLYTGFVYEGPALPRVLTRDLRTLLERDGYTHLREAVGADA